VEILCSLKINSDLYCVCDLQILMMSALCFYRDVCLLCRGFGVRVNAVQQGVVALVVR
jgi:hypothetical protein